MSKIDVQNEFVCTKCKKSMLSGSKYYTLIKDDGNTERMCNECASKVVADYMTDFPNDGAMSGENALGFGECKSDTIPEMDAEKKARWTQTIAKYEEEKRRLESSGTPLDWRSMYKLENLEFRAKTAKRKLQKYGYLNAAFVDKTNYCIKILTFQIINKQ